MFLYFQLRICQWTFATKTEPTETGLKIEFQLSSYIERADISSWIEQDKWFIINFYNIIRPAWKIFDEIIGYPIRDLQQTWSQNSQLSMQINRSIGIFDVILHDQGRKVLIILTYSDHVEEKKLSIFCIPDLKDAQKTHPTSWKDARERTTLEIICDTEGLPIYVDGHLVGYSPLKNRVDVLPGWHRLAISLIITLRMQMY